MGFLGDLERLIADLYPYRWPIIAAIVVVVAAVTAVGYRMGWHMVIWLRVISPHRVVVPIIAVPVLGFVAFAGYYTVSPLFQRTTLVEASPLEGLLGSAGTGGTVGNNTPAETPSPDSTSSNTTVGFTPGITYSGEFKGADSFHFGEGQALLIEIEPGKYTLRFENFSVRNGPGLYVYLSPKADGYTSDSLELGKLKATDGAFNYEVPAGTDVSQYKSVVVWCKPFSVLFAVAPLSPDSGVAFLTGNEGTTGGDDPTATSPSPTATTVPGQPTATSPAPTATTVPGQPTAMLAPTATTVPGQPKATSPALTATPAPTSTTVPESTSSSGSFTPGITHSGEFMGADSFHFGEGQALLIQTAPGQYVLRFENFSVRNGPDLFVYLSPKRDGYGIDSLELGKLKATDGAFNYDVPAGTDVSQYKSAVVWCKAFSVLFAVAPLSEL